MISRSPTTPGPNDKGSDIPRIIGERVKPEETKKILFKELSYNIMSAAFEVHNALGAGLTENIYENSLCYEFGLRGIEFEQQVPVDISYKGKNMGTYVIDVIVDGKIILELKAVTGFHEVHEAQIISYLKATNLSLGILINFGQEKVASKRILNTHALKQHNGVYESVLTEKAD